MDEEQKKAIMQLTEITGLIFSEHLRKTNGNMTMAAKLTQIQLSVLLGNGQANNGLQIFWDR